MPKRRRLVALFSAITLIIILILTLWVWKSTSRPVDESKIDLTGTAGNSTSAHPHIPKQYIYPSQVYVTLTNIHSNYQPTKTVEFVLAARPMKFVPDDSNTGHGTFVGSSIPHLSVVGRLVSTKGQLDNQIYVYELSIPTIWTKSTYDPLYLLANYELISTSKPQRLEGYSTLYQVLNPTS